MATSLEQGAGEPASLPPLEAYVLDDAILARANGQARASALPTDAALQAERPYVLTPVEEYLSAASPPQFVIDGLFETDSVIGIVAPPESGKSLLVQEMAVCVAKGADFHGRRTKRGLVVYLVGEGQHGLRARFQALDTRHGLENANLPLVIAKVATSLIDPVELARVEAAIAAHSVAFDLPLVLLIIDTLARFIAPGDESKAMDMGAYLVAVDALRGAAAAVSLHHPGHQDATRGRGSSSWKAGLDAEYSIANAGGTLTVSCQKMKDGEKPAPFSFTLAPTPTRMAREDGSAVQSVLLVPTDAPAIGRKEPTGKNQVKVLAALEAITQGPGVWTEGELRAIAKEAGLNRFQARDAVLGLRQLGYLVMTVGGSRLAE